MTRRASVTIYDVADRAGVSQAAVSVVLNGARSTIQISAATRQRIFTAASELGYVPNHAARSLSSRRTNIITVMTYGLDNPYFVDLVRGAQQAGRRRGYTINVVSVDTAEEENAALRLLSAGSSDGVINDSGNNPQWRDLADRGIPVVATAWYGKPDPRIPTISVDFERGGYLATRHLLELGHRRIAYVTDANDDQHQFPDNPVVARLRGYRRALDEAGIPFREELVIPTLNSPAGGGQAALDIVGRDKHHRPSAMLFFNDYTAVGGLHALWKAGIQVPDDIAAMGFDGTTASALTTPELTTIDVPRMQLGGLAVDTLLDMIDGSPAPANLPMLPVELIIRDSCGARRKVGKARPARDLPAGDGRRPRRRT